MADLERSVRVGLVVDEALSRASLTDVLSADPRLNVVHSIGGCEEARVLFTPQSLDVVVVDAELQDGNGVALSVLLQRDDPRLAVLLLSSRDATDLVLSVRMQLSRPWSHLSRRACADTATLVHAVVATAHGQVVLDPGPFRRAQAQGDDPLATLTESRLAVLRLVAQGLSNQAVARLLGLSARSVENHLAAVYRTLG